MPESDVTFFNRDGVKLAGVLNLPASATAASPGPAVLLCQGLSGVKHLVLPEITAGFAARGLTTLRFDYAGYGESEGDRGWIDPPARVDDALYAFAWLRSQEGVDGARVGVYGHSYGGPVAISLASREPKVRAVVSVSGVSDGSWMLSSIRTSWDWVAFKHRIEEERAKVAATGQSTLVDITEILPFSRAFFAANEKLNVLARKTAADIGSTMFRLASVDAILDFTLRMPLDFGRACPVACPWRGGRRRRDRKRGTDLCQRAGAQEMDHRAWRWSRRSRRWTASRQRRRLRRRLVWRAPRGA
jgi:dienelactone hydrolase